MTSSNGSRSSATFLVGADPWVRAMPPSTSSSEAARTTNSRSLTLRRLAAALAVGPRDLLRDERTSEPHQGLDVLLAALLHRDGTTSIAELAARLKCAPGDVLDAVDAYNNEVSHGLKIMGWHDE